MTENRALVAGWFSLPGTGATAGDLLVKDVICRWLHESGVPYDVALAPPFGNVQWADIDPQRYSHVVFACGPFFKSNLLKRFDGCRLIGVNLSMKEPVEEWNPFDVLLERDSSVTTRGDISFAAVPRPVPVVGLVLMPAEEAEDHPASYVAAAEAVMRFVSSRDMATVPIDTRLDAPNRSGLRTPDEIESLIARVDVVITTRLHGMVLALKHGVPAIALDPIPGGGKVSSQADAIGWPCVFHHEAMTREAWNDAFDFCLGQEARALARRCREDTLKGVEQTALDFKRYVSAASTPGAAWGDGRRRGAWPTIEATPPRRRSRFRRLLGRGKAAVRRTLRVGRL